MISTPRLRLTPATADTSRAELTDRAAFAAGLAASVPPDWPLPDYAEALPWFLEQLAASPEHVGWYGWYGVLTEPAVMIGGAGFLGPPVNGVAETGYSVLPAFRGQGIAGEMVGALVDWAFTHPEVERVAAETMADNEPSLRLLRRLGFTEVGPGRDAGSQRFERARG